MSNLNWVRESLADLECPKFSDSAWVAALRTGVGFLEAFRTLP